MKELENMLETIKNKGVSLIDLDIMSEINYQSEYCYEINFNEYEKELLLNTIHNAYLKSENLEIYKLTTVAINNIKDLEWISTYDLIDKAWEMV
jgi:hypothetical protein